MALPKGTKRFKHIATGEVRYFRNAPNKDMWVKIGTPGSKDWRWINNSVDEKFIALTDDIPEGYSLGRIKK